MDTPHAPASPAPPRRLGPGHPTVRWIGRDVVPLLAATVAPERVIVFDPPDRPADAGTRAPGLLIVASSFAGVAVAERVALVRRLLSDVSPVRPLCLTPGEYDVSGRVPGPVLAAMRCGYRIV